jgi:GGDEF domain-containing protein
MHPSVATWRGLAFILTAGFSGLLLTGLLEFTFPALSGTILLILKTSFAPLSGALALTYLGLWLGVAAEDQLIHATTVWGSTGVLLAAAILVGLALIYPGDKNADLLGVTATVNGIAAVLGAVASVRAMVLGDLLARWMVVAFGFLTIMVAGLHANSLHLSFVGTGTRILTAFSSVAFFLLATALSIRRTRMTRKLERLAGLSHGADPATGLPRGSVLLSKVDDAFWRSARMQRECTVICLHIRNLYELGEVAGHQVDQQILSALAARTRRAVGFRNVVGLYHPRCFVVVISAVKQPRMVESTLMRLRHIMTKPLTVVGDGESHHTFVARFGIGMVTVHAASADPSAAIDQAEQLALAADRGPEDALYPSHAVTQP